MAEAVAETKQTLPAAPGGTLISGLDSLGLLRQLGLMLGLAASVAIGFAVVLWSQEPDYVALAPNLNSADAGQVTEVLRQNDVRYRIDPSSGTLLVPSEKIHDIRMKLAAADVRLDGSVGLEVLDQDQGLGTSQFIETARYRRGLEGELARTISSMHGVRTARVHIAMPGRSVFVRDSRKPSASVLVDLYGGSKLEADRVLGIMNLVANSIPELERSAVTVVDQRGRMLSPDESEATGMVQAAKQFEYSRRYEDVLTDRVQSILEPMVGIGHFKAEVTADIDFTVSEQTAEQFRPDASAVRSEQIIGDARMGGLGSDAMGIPGALSNQPPGGSSVPEVADGLAVESVDRSAVATAARMRDLEQVIKNYELDRTISHTRNDTGRVRRVSVAVVVNDRPSAVGVTGARRAWTPEELAQVSSLVKDAVGFDEARGDRVNVVNSAFAVQETVQEIPAQPIWERREMWGAAKQLLGGLFVLLLVLLVLRPIMRNLSAATENMTRSASQTRLPGATEPGLPADQVTLSQSTDALLPFPEAGYESQLATVRGLAHEDPGRVAQVVKQMIRVDD